MIPLLESWNNFFKYNSETKAQAFQKFPWLEKSSADDDKEIVYMINNHSDIVQLFIDLKDEKGNPVFFHPQLVRNILYTCSYFIEKHPDIIKATLSDPKAMDRVLTSDRRDISFCKLVENPLPSTVKINPQAFDFEPKKEVTTEDILWATKAPSRFYMYVQLYDDPRPDYEELVNLVIKTKDTNGNPLLNDRAASETLYSASNLNQSKKFKAVLSDPEAIAVIASNKNYNSRAHTGLFDKTSFKLNYAKNSETV